MTQPDLFSYPHYAGYKAPGTSEEAAQGIEREGRAETLRQRVLEQFTIYGWQCTADEMAALLNEDRLAIRPRLSELRVRGLIVETGERRKNPGGRNAAVWRAA